MRICPFCLSEIESNNVDFLFEEDFSKWDFMDGIKLVEKFPLNKREDVKYKKFREKKQISMIDRNELMRVYVNKSELYELINMMRQHYNMGKLESVWDEDGRIDQTFTDDEGEELTIQYESMENEDSTLKIKSGISTARASMICSHCHNILPAGFFHYPQIMIGLIGKKDVGKTCMLVSMLANNMKAINGSRVLHFTEAQTMLDSGYAELRRKVMLLEEEGICPDPTRSEFIPPVILKAEWKIEEQRISSMVCIYDAAGELLGDAQKNKNVLANLMHTDGWLYLIDPRSTRLGTMIEMLSKENRDVILKKARILNLHQQKSIQQNSYGEGRRTVHHVMQELLTDVNTEAKISGFYKNLCDCYTIANGTSDCTVQPEVALILSKSDEMITFLNEKYGPELLLFDKEVDYISKEGNEKYKDRNIVIQNIFTEYVVDIHNMNTDDNVNPDVYLASALGCSATKINQEGKGLIYKVDGKYNPIRVGEAFVRMTMKLMQRRLEREMRDEI